MIGDVDLSLETRTAEFARLMANQRREPITCNGCGRFCRWNEQSELWECPGDCGREYDGPPPKKRRKR